MGAMRLLEDQARNRRMRRRGAVAGPLMWIAYLAALGWVLAWTFQTMVGAL